MAVEENEHVRRDGQDIEKRTVWFWVAKQVQNGLLVENGNRGKMTEATLRAFDYYPSN